MAVIPSISVCQSNDCKSLLFSETTGDYAANNLKGYGIPNLELTDFKAATLTITKPDDPTNVVIDLYSTFPTDIITSQYTVTNSALGYGTNNLTDGAYFIQYTLFAQVPVTGINTGFQTITMNLDRTGEFTIGGPITILGSSGNDGTYTVTNIAMSGSDTVVTVQEVIPTISSTGHIIFTKTASKYLACLCNSYKCLEDKLNSIEDIDCNCSNNAFDTASRINSLLLAATYAAKCGKPNRFNKIIAGIKKLCNYKKCNNC